MHFHVVIAIKRKPLLAIVSILSMNLPNSSGVT
ncbi:hypothetical protein PANI_CDS0004 [Maribacter phage Panino]